ncbi:hypothetical protein PHISP_01780 [Aspergillus sp. HF37]|nr:hypothetical protein PHISP_01780 [Aspergillus sp. HF37]
MSTRPYTSILLDLPPELRRDIFLKLFRSLTIKRGNHELAILRVCRQIYHEAAPLALPNVRVHCRGNASVIETLTKMGPAQITRLRYLFVGQCPIGFPLFPAAKDSQPGAMDERDHNSDGSNESDDGDDDDDGVRYFHLGAILALFPGLQLDLLEVYCGPGGGSQTCFQTTDCFGSLLEADGYRRLWMEAAAGDSDPWIDAPSTRRWKDAMTTNFQPYANWMVRIMLDSWDWEALHGPNEDNMWKVAQEAGFTLVQNLQDDGYVRREEGHDSEDTIDVVVDRGDADFAVKPDDDRVLRCIERNDFDESPEFFKANSDALKELFRVKSWEAIKAMDGFDDGTVDCFGGDAVYMKRV